MERIAILAGGGSLPLVLADSIVQRGGRAHIVGVRGEAGPSIEAYPHTWVTWGAVNTIISTLQRESNGTMMIAGSVSRPDILRLKPDFGLIRYLPQVLAMLKGGDDAVLTRLVRFFEAQGLCVKGVSDVAPQLLAAAGSLGAPNSGTITVAADTALGFQVLDLLADLDVGQAIAVEGGRILAIEGVEGTDRMLQRIGELPGRAAGHGVLVKGPKRGQDLRVDMPVVGAQTIARLAEAKLGTLVVVAGKTLMLERDEMVRRATACNVAITAVTRDAVEPATPAAAAAQHWAGPLLGRVGPALADARDARTAATVLQRLGRFGTGQSAVVVRDHVLAISAAEPPAAMARRVTQLRQSRRNHVRRNLGAAAIAYDASLAGADALVGMMEGLVGAGIAGVAVVAIAQNNVPCGIAAIPASAVAVADRLGLFLVSLAAPRSSASSEAA